jgi:transcriptional regulator with XRE-family HTH domain
MADPKDLRTMRLRKGLDLLTLADALGLDAVTLAAVECGELTATDELLAEWEAAIVKARAPRPWWRMKRREPTGEKGD